MKGNVVVKEDKLDAFLDNKEKELGTKLPDGVRINVRAIVNSRLDREVIIFRSSRGNGKVLSNMLAMEYLSN